jgi:hypothetical protein
LNGSGQDGDEGALILFRRIFARWAADLDLGRKVRLEITNIDNKTLQPFLEKLSSTDKIHAVNKREYIANGKTIIDLETRLNADELSKCLTSELNNEFLVDYETEVVITSGNYVADTVNVSVCQNYGTTTNDPDYCSGNVYVYGSARTKRRKTITTTNNVTGTTTTAYDNSCTDDVVSRGSAYINGQCGYVTPPTTCTAVTNYGAYSACDAEFRYLSAGTKARTISGTNTNCSTFSYTDYASCCQEAYQEPWSGWTPLETDNRYESRTTMFQNTSCTRYRVYQSRCRTTYTYTYGACGSNKRRILTTKVYVCGVYQSQSTASVPCAAV